MISHCKRATVKDILWKNYDKEILKMLNDDIRKLIKNTRITTENYQRF